MALSRSIANALDDREDVRLAILFGSHATGRTTPMSDVDVAVLFDPEPDMLGLGALVAKLEKAVGKSVDIVVLNGLSARSPVLARGIALSGQPLVVRDQTELLEIKTEALLRYLDTAGLRRRVHRRFLDRVGEGRAGTRNYD